MNEYEITNAQYVAFLNAKEVSSNGSYKDPDYGNQEYIDMHASSCMIKHNGSQFEVESGLDDYPVIMVTWYGANAYAQWAGGRLPATLVVFSMCLSCQNIFESSKEDKNKYLCNHY